MERVGLDRCAASLQPEDRHAIHDDELSVDPGTPARTRWILAIASRMSCIRKIQSLGGIDCFPQDALPQSGLETFSCYRRRQLLDSATRRLFEYTLEAALSNREAGRGRDRIALDGPSPGASGLAASGQDQEKDPTLAKGALGWAPAQILSSLAGPPVNHDALPIREEVVLNLCRDPGHKSRRRHPAVMGRELRLAHGIFTGRDPMLLTLEDGA
jgi:hypothetical protein